MSSVQLHPLQRNDDRVDETKYCKMGSGAIDTRETLNPVFYCVLKNPVLWAGSAPLALPVKCPSVKPFALLSPQFKVKGATDEQVSEIIACYGAVNIT